MSIYAFPLYLALKHEWPRQFAAHKRSDKNIFFFQFFKVFQSFMSYKKCVDAFQMVVLIAQSVSVPWILMVTSSSLTWCRLYLHCIAKNLSVLINAFTIFEDKIKGFHESHFQCMTYFDVKIADLPIGTDLSIEG